MMAGGEDETGTALQLSRQLRSRRRTVDQLLEETLAAIAGREAAEPRLNAFISTAGRDALLHDIARARSLLGNDDEMPAPVAGIPVAVKDNICVVDLPTTCGSRVLEHYVSPYEATVVRRLRDAGALLVGKTNLDEFAMGSSTENSAFGPTRNPRNPGRVPGGSSGGSAAAVAAGLVPLALGSDTGGSVRQPASFCGVVGLRPTYGRVSRHGLVAFASSLDQIGTLARTVRDAAVLFSIIAGHDPLDATTSDRPVPEFESLWKSNAAAMDGVKIGWPVEYFPPDLDADIGRLCRDSVARLEELGAEVHEVSLPHTTYALPTYYIVASAEASSNLARYDGVHYGARAPEAESVSAVYRRTRGQGFGAEVKRRIMLGTYGLSAGYHDEYYGRAQRVRRRVSGDFEAGERVDTPVHMYASDVFTVAASLAGLPAISLPIGRLRGLPVGGQFIARRFDEMSMVRAARALEGYGR